MAKSARPEFRSVVLLHKVRLGRALKDHYTEADALITVAGQWLYLTSRSQSATVWVPIANVVSLIPKEPNTN